VKVGVITIVGFVAGIAWPRLAGIRPGPNSPADSSSAAASASAPREPLAGATGPAAHASLAASAPAAASNVAPGAGASAAIPAATASATPSGPPNVTLGRGAVIACKTQEGESLKGAAACGGLGGLDAIAAPHLRKLAQCPAVEGQSGKVVMVLNVDFTAGRVGLGIGKATTVPNHDGIATCMRPHAMGIKPGSLQHEHPRYTVVYTATLTANEATASSQQGTAQPASAGGDGASAAAASNPSASGDSPQAQVVWEVALVRDNPRTGQIVARLQRGTRVRVSAGPQEGWYRIKAGSGGAPEGWVYRGAIGR
jgi:hypothetical protein